MGTMPVTQLTTEPAAIFAGDTINWLIAVPDYPADGGWTLKYSAVAPGGAFSIVTTASGSDHLASVPGLSVDNTPPTADIVGTDSYAAGSYTLAKYVEHSDGSRVTIATLALEVKANLADQNAAYDNRTIIKKTLDLIEARMAGNTSPDILEKEVDGTRLKYLSPADLLTLWSRYKGLYQQEQAAERLNSGQPGAGRLKMRL